MTRPATTRGPSPPVVVATRPVFLDDSGRRWRRFRLVVLAVVVVLLALTAVVAPHVWASPALQVSGEQLAPPVTSADTGLQAPLVGGGPLVRVLEVRREQGVASGWDPFTRRLVVPSFPAADSRAIGSSRYVIQRYGYSAVATRTISLTFDDGPDPVWTPKLLDLLSQNKVPATFFTTGTMIAKYPELFRREVREGHAVANHTLTHLDVSSASATRARLEMVVSDRIIRAVTGTEAAYFRLPYEGNDVASTQATVDGILRAQRFGYVVASHDFDTDDWAYAAGQEKGAIPLPPLDGRNVTVLLHDGGGHGRKMTVDYVRRLIPWAKAQGYTFHTMPQVQPDLAERVTRVRPTVWDQLTLRGVQALYVWPDLLLRALFLFAVVSVVAINLVNTGLAVRRHRCRRRQWWPEAGDMSLPVSVLLAAYNEEKVIARTLRTVLASDFPLLDVVVVDDGSSDGTADVVRSIARDDARVVLVQQPNRGKARALNAGLSRVRGRYVVTLDADTVLTPTTVTRLVRHFALDHTGQLAAVAGVVAVGNRERNLLTRWQALEYLTQIGIDRAAQDELGAITIVPGACAAWRKEAIESVGGYTDVTLAEDCDLSLSLHRCGWRVTQDDEALAFTEAPDTVDALLAQRTRWVFGTLQSIWKHRDLVMRRGSGPLGWYVLPAYVASIVVPLLFLPFATVMAVYAAQRQGIGIVLVFFLLFMLVHLAVAGVAVLLMGERPVHLLVVPVYRVVQEPLRAYLLHTCVLMAIRGVRGGWHKLARTGAVDTAVVSVVAGTPPEPARAGRRGA
ncbi:bifunctional polysaccharide deacetylase/glycosyltransferase family 2 protein [Pedococcus cremeus]|uniref:bifunctional polysaccharide deacetylase/glycosyltransferase family 2 protein n=1 Tax=Pedococcus cremeus TaxID=587636 RepID=UPI000B80C69F|nr:glycosyltransferase [Pedococcus cremeus]